MAAAAGVAAAVIPAVADSGSHGSKSHSAHGDKNIPELDLKATQSGKHRGLLADTQEILRLNTVGGVAPAGSCSPGTIVGVPYQADYVFVQR